MTLQAYIDDSGSDPEGYAFVLAAFVAPAENWARFSHDWQALLERAPGAAYLKTAHAYALQEEFHRSKGWTRPLVDTFLLDAADIIKAHAAERVAVWVRREYFDKHLKTLGVPYSRTPVDDPYFLCFYHIILTIAALHSVITTEACDFIFDEQGAIGEHALSWWGAFKRFAAHGSKTDFSPFLGSPPIFGDEKTFKPLQAADLYAWHLRTTIRQNKSMYMPRPKPLGKFALLTGREEEITERKLIDMRDMFAETARLMAAADPNISLSTTSPPKRRRPRAKWFPTGI